MMIDDQHIDRPSADEANAEMADGFRKPTAEQLALIDELFADIKRDGTWSRAWKAKD